jgi:hypothetical protein
MNVSEQIVWTSAEDGLQHAGAEIVPRAGSPHALPIVCIHGLYATFYDPPYIELGRALARRGFRFITGNTRGQGFGAVLRGPDWEPICGGGGWERFDEAPRDIAGWLAFAMSRGAEGVILLGHSLGARKVAAYQAERQDPRVRALVALSPALHIPPGDPAIDELAARMVAEGRGRDLLPWPTVGCSMSAASYIEHARELTAVFAAPRGSPTVARLTCPLLALYGSAEGRSEADLTAIRANARAAAVTTAMVAGAGHLYVGHEDEVARLIATWAATLTGGAQSQTPRGV